MADQTGKLNFFRCLFTFPKKLTQYMITTCKLIRTLGKHVVHIIVICDFVSCKSISSFHVTKQNYG